MADYPVTLSASLISPISDVEQASCGYSVKYVIPYTTVAVSTATASADTVTVTLGTTPTNWYVDKALVNVTTAFAGTTALAVAVGSTSSVAAFVSSQSCIITDQLEMVSTLPILTNAKGTAALSLVATFTNSVGGSPSAITAGSATVYLRLVDSSRLP